MKKVVALVLALMLCLSLCACGGAGAGSPEKAVEKAYAKYDNAQDMYAARGIDKEESLKQDIMDDIKDDGLKAIKDELLEDWPDRFIDILGDEGDNVASLIGADKLGDYRTKIAEAASPEELADLYVELFLLFYDTYLDEVRELSYDDNPNSAITVDNVDNISVRELEGKDYNKVMKKLSERIADGRWVYLFGVSDVEAIYSVAYVITYTDSETESVDFDDGYYVLETSEGCFLYK